MEWAYLPNGKIDTDSICVDRIVLLPSMKSIDVFRERILTKYCSFHLFAADQSYPEDNGLKELLNKKIETDPGISIFVFGFDVFRKISPVSQKIFVIDDYLLKSYSAWNSDANVRRDISADHIVALMMTFFDQWDRLQRLGHHTPEYNRSKGYDHERLDWRLELITE